MLNILSNVSAAAEGREWYESLVSINPTTIVFTLINLLIIFLIFRFLLSAKCLTSARKWLLPKSTRLARLRKLRRRLKRNTPRVLPTQRLRLRRL